MSASSKAKAGNVDLGTIVKGFEGAYEQAVRDLGRFNLVIFGETGVGKSTLVNAIFGKDVAEAGAGRPVTKSTDYYEHPSGVLGIYDTKGIETGRSEEQILTDLRGIIASKRSLPLEHQIHAIWYSSTPTSCAGKPHRRVLYANSLKRIFQSCSSLLR